MTITIPLEDWIVTTTDLERVEEMLRNLPQMPEIEKRNIKRVRIGRGTFKLIEGVGKAVSVLAIVAVLAKIIEIIEDFESPRNRRRRRSYLCVSTCMRIISDAKADIGDGISTVRALTTETEAKRKVRKFRSRK